MNLYEILKDQPKGTKLWSPLCGKCALEDTAPLSIDAIIVKSEDGKNISFLADGRFYENGIPVLFPSRTITDWEVLKWKKGDVVVNTRNNETLVFSKWNDDEYSSFTATDCEIKDAVYNDCNTLGFKLLLPKVKFKPGQMVLVRNSPRDVWALNFFSHYLDNIPTVVGHKSYLYTIPYVGNEELLGTKKSKE